MDQEQFSKFFEQAYKLMQKSKDPVHDWSHIERVLINIKSIVAKLPRELAVGLDMKILKLVAAWHDIAFVFYNHGIVNYFFEGKIGRAHV